MVDNLRVCAVITAFNQGRFLGEALNSVMLQRDCNPEIIVVDDGSDDDTPAIARGFGDHALVIRKEHRGVAAARNTGWRTSSAELIAFLDGDDTWLSEKLVTQLSALRTQPTAGLIYSDTMRVRADGSPIDRWSLHMPPVSGDALLPMLRHNRVHTSTVIMRRQVLEELAGFDESLPGWEDIDLWTRTAERYPFAYVPRVLARYRMHGNGISLRALDLARGRLTCTEKVLQQVSRDRVPEKERRIIIAEVYSQLGVAYYLKSEMRRARHWLIRAWKTNPVSIRRNRSAETFLKSLVGTRIANSLRSRIRLGRLQRQPLPKTLEQA